MPVYCLFTHLAAEDVPKGREGVVHGLVVNALVQVFDEDVAHTRAAEGGVTLAPHDADGTALQHVEVHGVQGALSCNATKKTDIN